MRNPKVEGNRGRRPFLAWIALLCLAPVVAATLSPPASAGLFSVDPLQDDVDALVGDGLCETSTGTCTLRAAIQEANFTSGPAQFSTILLPLVGIHVLDLCCDLEDAAAEGDLDLVGNTEIVGLSPAETIVQQTVADRVFECIGTSNNPSPLMTLRDLTVTGGLLPGPTGVDQDGAGMDLRGPCRTTLENVVVSGNATFWRGGGLALWSPFIGGGIVLREVTVAENVAVGDGDGVLVDEIGAAGPVLIEQSSFYNNGVGGGAVGSGLYLKALPGVGAEVRMVNSTLSENLSDNIIIEGPGNLVLNNVTLLQTGDRTNVRFDAAFCGGTMTIKNSLIQNLSGEPNCDMGLCGVTISEGHNIDSSNDCQLLDLSDRLNTDAMVQPLADNGGPTLSHAIDSRSLAVDFITDLDNDCTDSDGNRLFEDQRTSRRPGTGSLACDVGAVELALAILADGFESGDTSAWSNTVP